MGGTKPAQAVDRAGAVLFDLFHTLTSIDAVVKWGRATHEILGITREAWLEQLFDKSRDRFTGKVKDPVTMIEIMAHAVDPSISAEAIRVAAETRMKRFENALTDISGNTRDVLARLRACGKRVGLVSNADAMEVASWDRSPIAGLFDCAVFSCEVGYAKPERQIYEICLGELGVQPADAVFVGDGGSDELKGARALGMTTVMMVGVIRELWPERIEPRLPDADFVIEKLEELLGAQPGQHSDRNRGP
jgi:putative hydrolase of the HAD superfamily